MTRWRFFIDRGGTFTDVIGVAPVTGQRHVLKLLSSDDAPLIAIRRILELAPGAPIPPCEVRLGTTLATNALLERKGVACALVITRGFGDLLEIGTQARPEIFALQIVKPQVLYSEVLEVDARCDAQGAVTRRADPAATLLALKALRAKGIQSVAIVVMHSYRNPELELELGEWARRAGFEHIALSHELAPEPGLLRRADNAVLDAYLTPLLRSYLERLRAELPGSPLLVMQSSGALTSPTRIRGAASLLSGPAGGVLGYAAVARRAGCTAAVGFDMGGTSTDVSRVGEDLPHVHETTLAGVRVLTSMLDVHTVAAGGGSLCHFDGHALGVGPHSAGAHPGPACYGDPHAPGLTITDVNLLLGRLQPAHFPFPLDLAKAEAAAERLLAEVHTSGLLLTRDELLAGLLSICNDNMAQAIAQVSLRRGFDVRADTLVVYGGAGGQHACAVAKLLGIQKLLVPALAGVLSAFGISIAAQGEEGSAALPATRFDAQGLAFAQQALLHLLPEVARRLAAQCGAQAEVSERGALQTEQLALLRYQGTESALAITFTDEARMRADFEAAHQRLYGYVRDAHPLEIVAVRVRVSEPLPRQTPTPQLPGLQEPPPQVPLPQLPLPQLPEPQQHVRLFSSGWHERVPVFARAELPGDLRLLGPVIVLDQTATLIVDPGFELLVHPDGLLQLQVLQAQPAYPEAAEAQPAAPPKHHKDPVLVEIIGRAFMAIAEQMGAVLQRTALSTNIRERLDFSCAVFDAQAQLIANAPHIPVHLGAMSESVAAIAERFPSPALGDVFVTNSPNEGGSHLPDITVVTPVFIGLQQLYYVASRGHHADVGGITPGSMPAFSASLQEEGVVLLGMKLVSAGQLQRATILQALASGPYPARYPEQNLADLQAQIAANHLGVRLLSQLVASYGQEVLAQYVAHLYDRAASHVARLRRRLGNTTFHFKDTLDDGTPLGVHVDVSADRMQIRFDAAPESPGNNNAPRAVVVSAVMYALRCLVGSSLPLNSGCLRDLQVITPEHSLLNPGPSRAVSSGNVETSQRVVDLLLGAFGALAASQGTMNNLTFGNADFAYYETVGGGTGAGPDFAGASGVQVHMTNTRITDAEVLESRYPVRLECFALRRGSGGKGRHNGGDGLVREFTFLSPVEVSLVSERRAAGPFGLAGGEPGKPGTNLVGGVPIPGRHRFVAAVGDTLRVETPGGGGFGAAPEPAEV